MTNRSDKVATDWSGTILFLVFLVVIGSFLGSSLFARYASSEIASLSHRLATNVSPSIEVLSSIRGSALQVQLALSKLVSGGVASPEKVRTVDDPLSELRSAVSSYLVLPLSPGERRVHDQLQQAWVRFTEGANLVMEHAHSGDFERARLSLAGLEPAAESLMQASAQTIQFNAKYGQALAEEIGDSRRRTAVAAASLTAASVLLGVVGAALLQRQARRRRRLVDERTRLLEARAAELEQFAGRVAHDIRGPLAAALYSSDLLASFDRGEEVRDISARLKRNLVQANAVITDLLNFARAGAKPDPGARTSPREVIADMTEDIDAEAAKHDIELYWQAVPPALVACSRGVYVSLLGNLLRNAIKYMGSSVTRRIIVRVTDECDAVRTEVEDSGPGIPKHQVELLFDPYFRCDNSMAREGLGLGLATVRKLTEGHGGCVGVSSGKSGGSRFWFTLPRAGSLAEDAAPGHVRRSPGSEAGPAA